MKHFVIAALLASVTLAGNTLASEEVTITPAQRETLGIATSPLQMADEVTGQPLPARVVVPPQQMYIVSVPQAGLLTSIKVAVGDTVRKGEELAVIQSPELIALQRDYLQAYSREELARSQKERDQGLFKEGIIAERRFRESEADYIEAAATRDERRQALLMTGLDISTIQQLERNRKLTNSLVVRSPQNGVVLERMSDTGERLQSAAPLFRIANLERLWLEVKAPLSDIQGLTPGNRISVPGYHVRASLTAIGREVDPENQTVLLRGEVSEGVELLRPGQFIEVQLASVDTQKQYRLPAKAIVRSGERTIVFVQTETGFRAQAVRLLSQQDDIAVITGELTGSEHVAIQGTAALKAAWQGHGGGE